MLLGKVAAAWSPNGLWHGVPDDAADKAKGANRSTRHGHVDDRGSATNRAGFESK
jgi:hypothetical protein